MKRVWALLAIIILAFGVYWFWFKNKTVTNDVKLQPLAQKKHSLQFNTSVSTAMNAYFEIKDALVEADSVKAKVACKKFISLLDSINLNELKKDTTTIFETASGNLNDAKTNAASLLKQTSITEMRQDFRTVSETLYPSFFVSINYEGPNMYWQNCPMAFGEGKEANWISNTTEIINPYLGKNHPEFKATMLHCGELKDTIKTR